MFLPGFSFLPSMDHQWMWNAGYIVRVPGFQKWFFCFSVNFRWIETFHGTFFLFLLVKVLVWVQYTSVTFSGCRLFWESILQGWGVGDGREPRSKEETERPIFRNLTPYLERYMKNHSSWFLFLFFRGAGRDCRYQIAQPPSLLYNNLPRASFGIWLCHHFQLARAFLGGT